MTDAPSPDVQIAIIGAGFSGLAAAAQLRRAGYTDLLVLERADEVGGVWRDNSYPGAACDVQSHLYSLSFAPNPGWSRSHSPQGEIWAYLRAVAREFDLLPLLRLGHEVLGASWDAAAGRWRISTSRGAYSAALLVVASGGLSEPTTPRLPGAERFAGPAFHTARWDHSVELAGKAVAVVGTGASAIQLIPAIQPVVGRLLVFQRTPPWVLPRRVRDYPLAERRLMARFPALARLTRGRIAATLGALHLAFRHPRLMGLAQRAALSYLARAVPDPALRAQLTPSYTLGCKRILFSSDYLPALQRPNVELVTAPIAELRERGVVTADGVERPAEVLIYATGFEVLRHPIAARIRGRDGRSLAEAWGDRPRAHLGTTVAGFPNLFMLQGPGTGLGHTSVLLMIEAQIEHLLSAIRLLGERGAAAIEPRPEAQAAFVAALDAMARGTVWTAGGCKSWYLDDTGQNALLWPGSTGQFRRRVRQVDPREYLLTGAP